MAADYPLAGLRVLELGEELSEFAGKMLAMAGADVLKVEPPGGARTRHNGPWYRDQPGPGRSLYFWHYNLAKRGMTLDVGSAAGRAILARLIAEADVVLTGYDPPQLDRLNLFPDAFARPAWGIWCAVTPFGLAGPYRDLAHSDLVQLALGGQAMVCGYDPVEWKPPAPPVYDTPPIAPQMWHTYHVVGNYTYIAILAALIDRLTTGLGQEIEVAAHVALDTCTEIAQPMYLTSKQIVRRQTARHASTTLAPSNLRVSRDGRLLHGSVMLMREGELDRVYALLEQAGVAVDPYVPLEETLNNYFRTLTAEEGFHIAQRAGMAWAPIRAPEENLHDPHFVARGVFTQVAHPELGAAFDYLARPWLDSAWSWRQGPRAPLPGEHNLAILVGELGLSRQEISVLAGAGTL